MAIPGDSMEGASGPGRGPGRARRDGDSGDVRKRLLDAATELATRRGFDAVGVREVAREAGVTPAMISYYFGDKQGLYEAMFDGVFDRLLVAVRELAASPAEPVHPVERFVRLYVEMLGRNPWIPRFLVREVLAAATPIRERFIERFASQAATVLPGIIASLEREGLLRDDLDPTLATLSLVGMSAFPFLVQPVLGPVFGYETDAAFRERLIEHTARLYLDGAGERRDS